MKSLRIFMSIAIAIVFIFAVGKNDVYAQKAKKIEEAKFITLGNCYLCQLRIEDAANSLNGVIEISWDASKEECVAKYESDLVTLDEIMIKIASVGHDTEWHRAPDEAYATLIGTCCEYDRWLTYVSVGKISTSAKIFSVFPNPVQSTARIQFADSEIFNNCIVKLFNLNGQFISEFEMNSQTIDIDLNNVSSGTYYLIAQKDDEIIERVKIIKQ